MAKVIMGNRLHSPLSCTTMLDDFERGQAVTSGYALARALEIKCVCNLLWFSKFCHPEIFQFQPFQIRTQAVNDLLDGSFVGKIFNNFKHFSRQQLALLVAVAVFVGSADGGTAAFNVLIVNENKFVARLNLIQTNA